MRFVRPRPRSRRIALGVIGVVAVLLWMRDRYRLDERNYADVYLPAPGGELHVALDGSYAESRDVVVKGNPYQLLVRYLTPDSTLARGELVALTLRGVESGRTLTVRADSAMRLRDVSASGTVWWGPDPHELAGGHVFAALVEPRTALGYEDYAVTGTLRLTGPDGAREVPIAATLRRTRLREWRSRFWDGFMSV